MTGNVAKVLGVSEPVTEGAPVGADIRKDLPPVVPSAVVFVEIT